jgi:hypothetical protein
MLNRPIDASLAEPLDFTDELDGFTEEEISKTTRDDVVDLLEARA